MKRNYIFLKHRNKKFIIRELNMGNYINCTLINDYTVKGFYVLRVFLKSCFLKLIKTFVEVHVVHYYIETFL